jgi:hypothetical protein
MRSRIEWAREYSTRVIAHAERWAEREGIALDRQFTYPKVPCSGYATDRDQWKAWHVDALMNAAHAILKSTDPATDPYARAREWQYAARCFWQACEYLGRCEGYPADVSWHDEHQVMRGVFDDAARVDPLTIPEAV